MHMKEMIRVLMKLDIAMGDLSNTWTIKVKVIKSKKEHMKL